MNIQIWEPMQFCLEMEGVNEKLKLDIFSKSVEYALGICQHVQYPERRTLLISREGKWNLFIRYSKLY